MSIDIHRPELHFTPESGILDAPAGVLLDGQTYHLFFQYRPDGHHGARWGHVYAEETPFDWLECNDALAPAGGEIKLRAGSVAAVGEDISLFYTSVTSTTTSIHLARYDRFPGDCDVSDDYLALDPLVQRHGVVVSDTKAFTRFRSPSVVPGWLAADRDEGHSGWLMLAVTGSTEAPIQVILSSPDGENWTLEGPIEFDGDTGIIPTATGLPAMTAPRIVRLRDEVDGRIYDILLVTLEREELEISGYLVGRLEGSRYQVAQPFQRLDYGHDFTRPRQTNATPGTDSPGVNFEESLIFGLLNGAGRRDDATKHFSLAAEGWANTLSLPRHLTLQGGKIYQTPPRGLTTAVENSDRARSWTGLMEVPSGSAVTVTVLDGQGHPAAVITHSGEAITLDRSMSRAFNGYLSDKPAVAPLDDGDSDTLTIVVDGSTVEVFADGGQVAMASRVYFAEGCSGFEVDITGDAAVTSTFERRGSKI